MPPSLTHFRAVVLTSLVVATIAFAGLAQYVPRTRTPAPAAAPSSGVSESTDTIRADVAPRAVLARGTRAARQCVVNSDVLPSVCVVTALVGTYEKTLKQVEVQEGAFAGGYMFAFTDRADLLERHNAIVDGVLAPARWHALPLHVPTDAGDCRDGERNSPCTNRHPFNLAKFYKMQFFRVPLIAERCDVVAWCDATLHIKAPFFAALTRFALEDKNLVVYVHARRGNVAAEVRESSYAKYSGASWNGHVQPVQPVDEQFAAYTAEGFTSKWFDANGAVYTPQYGLYVTCMVMFDLRKNVTYEFLDAWWQQNLQWTTQDQVSFPYVAWKLNVFPYALPDHAHGGTSDNNALFRKLRHGV
mmetsp:Transcript_15879/g.39313  ORF Transcript_15879/g.39313 Transcript_15879/m.39313 type:complete len:359 (+) Transcript_15879:357-1433(+)